MKNGEVCFLQGNDAITRGAVAAGARFYAGYPITPSSEVAELSSQYLPKAGGLYVQMEDELGSIAAIIGASASGKKAYTATSGPGFSLMQENLGVAIMGEVPIVIVDVQRSGPSTGLATKPAQMDVMQARWGTHGDHGIIVLSPSSVQDCYDLTIRAFNLAEKYRTPVVFLADEIVGHMREKCCIYPVDASEIVERKKPTCPAEAYRPFDFEAESDHIAPLASYGDGYIFKMSGSMHNTLGWANAAPDNADKFIRHYVDKIEDNRSDIVQTRAYHMEDADIVLISFGASARPSLAAMERARQAGLKVGFLQLVTIWPFAEEEVRAACAQAKAVIVPEMNLGQVIGEVKKCSDSGAKVYGVNKVDSTIITPDEILKVIWEAAK